MMLFLAILVPTTIGLCFGLRARKDIPMTPKEFAIGAGWAIGFCLLSVFAWHAVWIGAALTAMESDAGLARQAANWTVFSGAIWLPVLMITYVVTAMRAKRAD